MAGRERKGSTVSAQDVAKAEGEEDALAQLGYQQELKRSFGLVSMVGFSFSIVTCWTALSGVLIIGVTSGGPPVMVWSWLGICAFSLAVAYSMAEMCSAYPVAGGQYSWAAILAPPKVARTFSYVNGWFMLIGILAMGATNNFVTANFICGMANLAFPGYEITRWQATLVAYAVGIFALSFNVFTPRLLDNASKVLLVWNVASFIIVIVTVLACNDHKQSAEFVFQDFVNFSGFNRPYAAIIGLLNTGFGMCCYDAPSHMTEEINDARRQAPRAIILSVFIGAFTGFVFLIAICFCIGNIEETAASTTGVPLIQIFYDSTGSRAGAICLTVLITVICVGASNALTAEGGRAVYAFARDRGLPFSGLFSKVDKKKSIPVFALILTVIVQLALNSIYFGTLTGFETVVSIATLGFYVSYAMPLLARLLSSFTGTHTDIQGLYNLGKFSVPLNVIGLLYLVFLSITFNFPTTYPVTSENMNYTCAAIGIIMLIAAVTWVTTGRKQFRGPEAGDVFIDGREPRVPETTTSSDENTNLESGEKARRL
ncbi:GABA permease [Polychaeton citri CBS 116435]|uniref:GABA permease n=1 Tax=Polychaeton citri CBS 116435 TaxID=1314669 RepID=A0A9P4Q0U6_9PEZI|nr:GABA permease [Polychaeton citri CBS 116435]